MEAADRRLALSILSRMGETGQPPERGALHVNAGTDEFLELLRTEYLKPLRELGRVSAFKLVQATFGGGKTHFLHCLREVAWQEGFVVAKAELSRNEVPCDDPVRVYQAVAQRLEAPPEGELEEGDPGIDVILRLEVDRRLETQPPEALRAWLQREFGRARIDSHAIRSAAKHYMLGLVDGDDAKVELMGAFLRGEDVLAQEVREYGVRETLERATAFRFLRSLVQTLRALDVPGVVLLFDEMDRVMAIPRGRRQALADTVREVIDSCGQAVLPAVLWVYAVPPEFMASFVDEYPALAQRLRGVARLADLNPQAPLIDLERVESGQVALLTAIGERLFDVYQRAHDEALTRAVQSGNLALLARRLGEDALEIGARRTFVKAAVRLLTEQHRGGERRLGPHELDAFATTASAELSALPGEESFTAPLRLRPLEDALDALDEEDFG